MTYQAAHAGVVRSVSTKFHRTVPRHTFLVEVETPLQGAWADADVARCVHDHLVARPFVHCTAYGHGDLVTT